jgi:hypothetical protein
VTGADHRSGAGWLAGSSHGRSFNSGSFSSSDDGWPTRDNWRAGRSGRDRSARYGGPAGGSGRGRPLWYGWRAAWPCYLLAAFAALALDGGLPAGPARAVFAVPVLLLVPGALTLGAVMPSGPGRTAPGRSFEPATFCCLAAVLSVLWLAFAALLLNVARVAIGAHSEYLCLLAVCVALAAVAQRRLRRAAPPAEADVLGILAEDAARGRRAGWYPLVAVTAGLLLLAGGAYGNARTPQPAPAGYTWLAWTGAKTGGVLTVGPSGRALTFQIKHQQRGTAEFRLTAVWIGNGRRHPLASPVTVRIGQDMTFHGTLSVPRLPGGCAYRVQLTLTELAAARPLTLSINADVRARPHPGGLSGGRPRGCAA